MNERRDEAVESARVWLDLAGSDLVVARRSLWPPPVPGAACLHAQQAAEKALKAYLLWLGADRLPRTHDLEALAGAIVEGGGAAPPMDALRALTGYAVAARYAEGPLPSVAEAEAALERARGVVQFVRTRAELPGD